MRPATQFFARSFNAFVNSIRNHPQGACMTAGAVTLKVPALVHGARVRMAPGHRKDASRIEEAWASDQAVLYSSGQPEVPSADVSYGGKPAVQHETEFPDRICSPIRLSGRIHFLPVNVRKVR